MELSRNDLEAGALLRALDCGVVKIKVTFFLGCRSGQRCVNPDRDLTESELV